jgi:hypothetical protein
MSRFISIQAHPPRPCTPFTECWCEQRPNHPRCSEVDSVSIDSNIFVLVFIAILIGVRRSLIK